MKSHFLENHTQSAGVVPRSTDVEVIVLDTTGRYQLPDSNILRGKTIVGVSCRVQAEVGGNATVFTPLGRTVVSQTVINAAYLTLQADELRFIENLPLADCVIAPEDRRYTPLDNIRGFNPTKSLIYVANPGTPAGKLVVGQAFVLQFFYID
jgi:hypothetical protein